MKVKEFIEHAKWCLDVTIQPSVANCQLTVEQQREAISIMETQYKALADKEAAVAEKDREVWVHKAAVQQRDIDIHSRDEEIEHLSKIARLQSNNPCKDCLYLGMREEIATLTTKLGENQATLSTLEEDYESAGNRIIALRAKVEKIVEILTESKTWMRSEGRDYDVHYRNKRAWDTISEALAGKEVDHE